MNALPDQFRLDDLYVDLGQQRVTRAGMHVQLPKLSFDLLVALAQAAPKVVSINDLMSEVWSELVVNPETVAQRVKLLRDALGDDPRVPRYIESLRSRGYRLLPSVAAWRQRTVSGEPAPSATPDSGTSFQTASPTQGAIPEKSIAVLPFLDMSAKHDQEYFSDGLAEALIDLLTQVRDLRVPARTSSFYFKGKSEELASIAEKLRVAHILEGSVRKAGSTIRVTAHLIRAENGYHLWSKTFDRDLKDIFKVQDEIAGVVVEALKAQLLPPDGVVNQHRTASTEAYEQYLVGRHFHNRNTLDGYLHAAAALQRAIALDPNFASGYAMLAFVKSNLAETGVEAAQNNAEALVAANKAVALAPELAEAHCARGYAHMRGWNWGGAQADLEKAIQLEPNYWASHSLYGYLLTALGRFPEAIVALQTAIKLAPLNAIAWLNLGICLYGAGQYSYGREALARVLDLSPESAGARFMLARIELMEGQADAALETNSQQKVEMFRLSTLAMAEHALGHPSESQKALDKLLADQSVDFAARVASVYAWRGETDQSFEWLERAYRQHAAPLWIIKMDRSFDCLHDDPRYKALLRKMNLPE